MALLSVEDVGVRFGGVVALDGLSFTVEEGSICALIGPNGAGKTTLFNVLSRLYEASQGKVEFDGHNVLKVPAHRIAVARHGPHVPERGPVPGAHRARERDDGRPQPGHGRLRPGRAAPRRRQGGAGDAASAAASSSSASTWAATPTDRPPASRSGR